MVHSGVLYKFPADGRAPQTSQARGRLANPLPHPLDGPEWVDRNTYINQKSKPRRL